MKYLYCYSYQNGDYPKFKDFCHRLAKRYLIECHGRGIRGWYGEFEDNDADFILSKLKNNVEEKDYGYIRDNGLKQIPIEVKFEKFANGYRDDEIYSEFIINKK